VDKQTKILVYILVFIILIIISELLFIIHNKRATPVVAVPTGPHKKDESGPLLPTPTPVFNIYSLALNGKSLGPTILSTDKQLAFFIAQIGSLHEQDGNLLLDITTKDTNGRTIHQPFLIGSASGPIFFALQKQKTNELYPSSKNYTAITLSDQASIKQTLSNLQNDFAYIGLSIQSPLLPPNAVINPTGKATYDKLKSHFTCNHSFYQALQAKVSLPQCLPYVYQLDVYAP
jgi:hypothetical protein